MGCSSRNVSLRFLLALSLTLVTACIESPELDPIGEGTGADGAAGGAGDGAAPIGAEGDDRMVLIPTTTFAGAPTLKPASPDQGKGDAGGGDKKKPGGGGGGGGTGTGTGGGATPLVVPAFWIDVTEVSAAAYDACVRAGACTAAGNGDGCTPGSAEGTHPANCVTIDQARTFCATRGKRLVKNDEWTAAAAGSALRPYPWGADPPSATHLNACGRECATSAMYAESDGFAKTAPRGSFVAGRSPDGVADLAGNVAEWVDLPGTSAARGGSFADVDRAAVSSLSFRAVAAPDASIGFRCARDGSP